MIQSMIKKNQNFVLSKNNKSTTNGKVCTLIYTDL